MHIESPSHTNTTTTFSQVWDHTATLHGSRPFLRFLSDDGLWSTWTYAEFDQLVGVVAGRLAALGVKRKHTVHMCLKNSPGFIAIWLACSRLGATMIPVDPATSAREISRQFERTKPTVGVASVKRYETYTQGAPESLQHILWLTEDERDLTPGSALLEGEPEIINGSVPDLLPADRLALMFTSGTTSEPKAVSLTQANYSVLAQTMPPLANLQAHHRWFVTLPVFHGNAQFYCFASAVGVGASVALTSRFSASQWLRQAGESGATHASLFAAPIRMILLRTPESSGPLSLEHVWFAQNLSADQYRAFRKHVGVAPRQLYGMTETVAIVTADRRKEPSNDSIGTVISERDILVVDPVNYREVTPGEQGLLLVAGERGIDLFEEYLDNPSANEAAFVTLRGREWLVTGDMVREQSDSSLIFVGRTDDIIKVSGENVSLTEIEETVAQAPGIAEIAVLAADDPIRDKVPVAYFVPKDFQSPPSAPELEAWAAQNLAPASRPRAWHLTNEIPKTSVGKIQRFRLQEQSKN